MSRILKASASSAAECVKALAKGRAVVYPTETVYGLGVDATNRKAVRLLFRIKKRDPKKPTSIAVANLKEAEKIAHFNKLALKLAKKFLPGPLTLVLKAKKSLPVLADDGTIGIRIPDSRFTHTLLLKFKKPITATSANISGARSASDLDQIDKQLLEMTEIIIDGSRTKYKIGSTVVDATGDEPKILREGAISRKSIENVLNTKIV